MCWYVLNFLQFVKTTGKLWRLSFFIKMCLWWSCCCVWTFKLNGKKNIWGKVSKMSFFVVRLLGVVISTQQTQIRNEVQSKCSWILCTFKTLLWSPSIFFASLLTHLMTFSIRIKTWLGKGRRFLDGLTKSSMRFLNDLAPNFFV